MVRKTPENIRKTIESPKPAKHLALFSAIFSLVSGLLLVLSPPRKGGEPARLCSRSRYTGMPGDLVAFGPINFKTIQ